ncbi:MAG: 2-dehydro-3-deoxygluconokinase [Desulfovibrio sp.]
MALEIAPEITRKTAFIGECMIELQKKADGSIHQAFGGDTFNSAAYFSRLGKGFGITAEYVSAIGDDNFSRGLRAFWDAENVASSLTRPILGRRPGLYFIEVDETGERSFTYWRGEAAARDAFTGPESDAVLEGLALFDAVYLSGISLAILRQPGRERLLARLRELQNTTGLRVFFDCNFRPNLWTDFSQNLETTNVSGGNTPAENARPWYEKTIALADIVFISFDEIAALGFSPDVGPGLVCAAIRDLGAAEAVVKNGGNACVVAYADNVETVRAHAAAKVTDTTAAGDSFAAAYLMSRRLGCPPADAAMRAHILAATVISYTGAIIPQTAMPDLFPDKPRQTR